MGVLTKGVTFAVGSSVTHLNYVQLLTSAGISGIGRGNLDPSAFSFLTRATDPLPAPSDKEAWIATTTGAIASYDSAGGVFEPAMQSYVRTIWSGSVAITIGEIVKSLGTKTGAVLNVDKAKAGNLGFLGVATIGTAVGKSLIVQTHGVGLVKVAGSVTRGRALVPGAPNGAAKQFTAGDAPETIIAIALESGTDTNVWAYIQG